MRLVYLDFPSRLDVQFFQVHRPAMDLYVRSIPRRSTLNTWRGILTTICCFHARVSIRWQFMTLRDIRNGSRPKMKILTRRTLRRSANSLREPRSKIKPKGRPNRLVPTGEGHQRKAPLARLPEHPPKLKQPPHPRRRVCVAQQPAKLPTGSPQWCSPRSTVHWRMAEMAWTLVPKGHQTRPH